MGAAVVKALLAGFLLAATAAAAEPLSIFEPLVGGQWISSSKLPDGREVRSRTVWTWGAGKRLVRMRQFVLGDQGEVQRYETIVAVDGARKSIVYLVFSEAGLLSRGTARADGQGVLLEQPALESFPAMRTAYAVAADGVCTVRISFLGEAGWKQRIESKLRRTEIGTYKRLGLERAASPLEPLAPFLGAWKHRTAEDAPAKAVSVGEWSLHHRLLRIVDGWTGADGKKPFWERYVSFDAKSGKLLVFLVDEHGGFFEGTVQRGKDVVIWRFAGTAPGGKAIEARFRCTLAGEDRQEWRSESLEDGEWVEGLFGSGTSRRAGG